MSQTYSHTQICQICKNSYKKSQLFPSELVRHSITSMIKSEYPDWSERGFICYNDLNHYRTQYISTLLADELGESTALQQEVTEKLMKHETLALNTFDAALKDLTVGQILADKIAAIGGSWTFIISFLLFLFIWMGINSYLLIRQPFDPYPFILLNLVLSTLAAIQAPLIIMSQRRQEIRDRLRAENDYRVNLKAELEIRQLHEKVDHILLIQWKRMLEIQEIQIELLNELKK
ncbi:MAG: DUF1003 domain-containing protein [Calditrichales bacterium]|nr:MAG: DUF1003 domain-containing protein [Calditrichales bacterium]